MRLALIMIGMSIMALGFVQTGFAQATTPNPAIYDAWYVGTKYTFVSQANDGNGHALLQYTNYNGGSAVLTWSLVDNDFVSMTFSPAGAASATYTAGNASQPYGELVKSGNGSNDLWSIGAASYNYDDETHVYNGGAGGQYSFASFVYSSETYNVSDYCSDMLGGDRVKFVGTIGGTAEARTCDQLTMFNTLRITTANGLVATYNKIDLLNYVFFSGSTGANLLTSFGGVATHLSSSSLSISSPGKTIRYGEMDYSLYGLYFDGNNPGYYYKAHVGAIDYFASIGLDGALLSVGIYLGGGVNIFYEDGVYYGRAGSLYYTNVDENGTDIIQGNHLTAIGTTQYIRDGNFLIPAPPQTPDAAIKSFQYNGQYYSLNGLGTWSDGYAVYQYHGANGSTAAVKWDPFTKTISSWTIHPISGGTATYAPGATAGSYALQSGSTAPNALSWVNNVNYAISGNTVTPPTISSENGDLFVQGNQFNLGVWTGDLAHVGMSITYFDGGTTYVSSIYNTANRPHADWIWEHATPDGNNTKTSMVLDAEHQLQLYAKDQLPTPTGITPTIILNPSGVSRFDKPVRIAPQGDLSMGEFTTEPTPAP